MMLPKEGDYFAKDGTAFKALDVVNTEAATPAKQTIENIIYSSGMGLPKLHQLEEFKKEKSEPIALIGGGPSIKTQLDKIKEFKIRVACGSVHDYLAENNIYCEYATVCDPDPISANYLQYSNKYTKYLVSTGCDKSVFDTLEGNKVYTWNCYSEELAKIQRELDKDDFRAIGGGCTVGLRSLSIALMLGYMDIHFFGFDSCLDVDNTHHAYDFSDKSEELGYLYKVRIGTNERMNQEKEFTCVGYHIAQAQHYKDFYIRYNKYYRATFHGEGMLQELVKTISKEEQKYKVKFGYEDRALESLALKPNGSIV